MSNARRLIPFLALFSLACGLVVPVPPPTPLPPTATQTSPPTATATNTPNVAATQTVAVALTQIAYTATPTATATPEISPEDLLESEAPLAPPAVSPGADYELKDELKVGAYGIRLWHDTRDPMGFSDIAIIERNGIESIYIEQASAIADLSGSDINADGDPEVIIETYSGGAHCCFGTQVYRLGAAPQLILQKPESNAGGFFEDLNNDDILEFITADDIFAYQYCAYAASPFAKVILQYDSASEEYLPASPRFPEEFQENIERNLTLAESTEPGELGEWDETSKCSVLPLMLDYIYLGDFETAQSELTRLYPYPDAQDFWDEVMLYIQDSTLYVPAETE